MKPIKDGVENMMQIADELGTLRHRAWCHYVSLWTTCEMLEQGGECGIVPCTERDVRGLLLYQVEELANLIEEIQALRDGVEKLGKDARESDP